RPRVVAVVGGGGGADRAVGWGAARGQRLLLPQAADAHPALAGALRRGGAEVTVARVYRTVPRRGVDMAPFAGADLVCFFAPSAVRAFVALDPPTAARWWAHGPTTSAALREAGLEPTDLDL
ncbi:MAG: uroporphyrinogen-III synthase, partial [Planctomycetota bacterium]